MFEWICSIGVMWGLLVTGVGVIVGLAIVVVGGIFITCWIADLWDMIPYRIRTAIEKIGRGIRIGFVVVGLLGLLVILTVIAYDGICGI